MGGDLVIRIGTFKHGVYKPRKNNTCYNPNTKLQTYIHYRSLACSIIAFMCLAGVFSLLLVKKRLIQLLGEPWTCAR